MNSLLLTPVALLLMWEGNLAMFSTDTGFCSQDGAGLLEWHQDDKDVFHYPVSGA